MPSVRRCENLGKQLKFFHLHINNIILFEKKKPQPNNLQISVHRQNELAGSLHVRAGYVLRRAGRSAASPIPAGPVGLPETHLRAPIARRDTFAVLASAAI